MFTQTVREKKTALFPEKFFPVVPKVEYKLTERKIVWKYFKKFGSVGVADKPN
jgi:hypothetical protein